MPAVACQITEPITDHQGQLDREPARNWRCPNYDRCLADAAKAETFLTCQGCRHQSDQAPVTFDSADIAGMLALIAAVFNPALSRQDTKRFLTAAGQDVDEGLPVHLRSLPE